MIRAPVCNQLHISGETRVQQTTIGDLGMCIPGTKDSHYRYLPHACTCIRQIMRVLGTGIDIGIQSELSTGNNTLLALAVVNGLLHLPVPVLLQYRRIPEFRV